VGLLDGDIAKAIYAGFKNKLLTGTLRVETESMGNDEYGDPLATVITTHTIQGFTDEYSAFFRAQSGIPDTDLKVGIFAQSIPGITPSKDDKVKFRSTWYQIRKVNTDPAIALWECQSFEIPAPIDGS
jgi:hypothetical protein